MVFSNGGADGIRTHDLLDAIEARSQLRHGPTGGTLKVYHTPRQTGLFARAVPHSMRLYDDVSSILLAQHGVERRNILRQELLNLQLIFIAPFLQIVLHRQLLRGGRKI